MWSDALHWIGETARGSAGRLIGIGIALIAVLLLVRWAQGAAAASIAEPTARYRTRKLIGWVGALLAALAIWVTFSSSLAGLSVLLGVIAAGVAFALQEVIVSVAGWVAITSGGAYQPGDRIELAGVKGDVIDIGVLKTTLMEIGQWVAGDLYSGRIVRVANSALFKQPVFNYTKHFPFVWDEIRVPIQYASDRGWARRILETAAAEVSGAYAQSAAKSWAHMVRRYLIEDAQVAPMVTLAATDNWLEYTVRYPVDAKLRRSTRDRLFSKILDAIDASDGRVSIASSTVQVLPPPPARAVSASPNAAA